MSSEVRHFIASEVRYWWRSLTLQDRLYGWTGLWLDSAMRSHSRDVRERIEAHDSDLATLRWPEMCGEWFWRMWRIFLCWLHFVSTNIMGQYIPSLCIIDMNGKTTLWQNVIVLIQCDDWLLLNFCIMSHWHPSCRVSCLQNLKERVRGKLMGCNCLSNRAWEEMNGVGLQ